MSINEDKTKYLILARRIPKIDYIIVDKIIDLKKAFFISLNNRRLIIIFERKEGIKKYTSTWPKI